MTTENRPFRIDDNVKLPLGGDWVAGTGEKLTLRNPADGSVSGTLAASSLVQVSHALEAAQRAAQSPTWFSLPPFKRADFLYSAAALIIERSDKLGTLQSLENGKSLKESTGQALAAAGIVRYFAALCETLVDDIPPARGPYLSCTLFEPHGVVAAITPWNSPLTMAAQKIAPALAAGNAVLLKPSELTSVVSIELARCFLDAGLPSGLLSVVPGGQDVGQALVENVHTDMVSFTGGTAAGRQIASAVAGRFIPTVLELGGKSPNIVFADADLEAATSGVVSAIFGSGGQSCVAGSRLFVEKTIYRQFLDLLVKKTAALRLGDPFDGATNIGPMASFAQRDRVESYVQKGREEGGRVLIGGERPRGAAYDNGAYYLPTILEGLDHSSAVFQEEIFGGVLAVLPFDGVKEVITLANDSVYGLACGIWTADIKKAWLTAKAIKAGTVWINCYKELSISAPFGGHKDSGLSREKGIQGLRVYQTTKSIYLGGFGENLHA